MVEIRAVKQLPITRTIKVDSEGPKLKQQVTWDPAEAIKQLYRSKSDMGYKNRSKSSNSCPVRETRTPRIQAAHAFRCSFLLGGMLLDNFQRN